MAKCFSVSIGLAEAVNGKLRFYVLKAMKSKALLPLPPGKFIYLRNDVKEHPKCLSLLA